MYISDFENLMINIFLYI